MYLIRVAFKKNSLDSALEDLFCLCSLDRHIHAEIRFFGYTFSSFYGPKYPIVVMPECNTGEWDFQDIPVNNPWMALDIIETIFWQCRASYSFNPFDMALPESLLNFVKKDLCCTHPQEWKHIFCSQLVLLFLRRCALAGILCCDFNKINLLWSVNTHGCTPAHLKTLLECVFGYETRNQGLRNQGLETLV